jgi:hypothetical protein
MNTNYSGVTFEILIKKCESFNFVHHMAAFIQSKLNCSEAEALILAYQIKANPKY